MVAFLLRHAASICACTTAIAFCLSVTSASHAVETTIGNHTFTLPDGFEISRVAGPPLVDRPICADFDELGRLYVADSSGSNDKVAVQLEQKPHRIVRLEDTDHDGIFDKSVVFAAGMMFPEGTLWYDGSLYVCAPPVIWKLTDTDGDGEADVREEWFDAKTLTGCANDLHGPYLGPDGWIYWCKGAFAEQTYERPGREPFVTKAAHIFRRRPDGGPVEPVMTGGMDNPVEVAFTPGGERIFSTTFLQHPASGFRDGLIHAIYGGVYGKVHGVLDGHPRTGDIMPPLVHHGPAASCGLLCLESDQLGRDYEGNLLACLFNMHCVKRHVLTQQGATFKTGDSDFILSDNIDFHPTDILEDADGTLILIDTGGWYKLCCPTSNLWKPDILGAIYRIRRTGSHQVADPRGSRIDWISATDDQLATLLNDSRPAVRKRAGSELRNRPETSVPVLAKIVRKSTSPLQRRHAVWTLTSITDNSARDAVRPALGDPDETVRQAALHSVSVWRDAESLEPVLHVLREGTDHNRRAAAEALGRFGSSAAVEPLLNASLHATDRILDHSLIYALIEIGDADSVQPALADGDARVRRSALITLDQMPQGGLRAEDVVPVLDDPDGPLREAGWWIAEHHPEWAPQLAETFRASLHNVPDANDAAKLAARLPRIAADPAMQQVMAECLLDGSLPPSTRQAIVDAMAATRLDRMPEQWSIALVSSLRNSGGEIPVASLIKVAGAFASGPLTEELIAAVQGVAGDSKLPGETRLQALSALPAERRDVDDQVLAFLCESFSLDQPVSRRATAIDVLTTTPLANDQLLVVADALPTTGPMELQRLIELFSKSNDQNVGRRMLDRLSQCDAVTAISVDALKRILSSYGDDLLADAAPLCERIVQDNQEKYQQLESILAMLDQGDIRRGQRVFHDTKLACNTCHQMGYLGGGVGPDLTRIGRIRSERDLLEAILFPSASFVRSYEPTTLLLTDGRVLNGVVRDETAEEVTLQLDAQKIVHLPVSEIEERHPGTVSVMPAGLEKQLTAQQLADLVTFLKAAQ